MNIQFEHSYAALPERFVQHVKPTPVSAPRLIRINRPLATLLGIDPDFLVTPEGIAILSGNRQAESAEPVALAYAGHQFGNFVPQLGDGRAILLGEIVGTDGKRRDIQLKGAGRTRFSRGGDGRAALGPVLREYILSEAMATLGIPTTRALAAVLTGDRIVRDTPLPGAILTRVASSHIRVGTFQYFAARGDTEAVKLLADYTIARHYPAVADLPKPYLGLLAAVNAAQAQLVAQWMLVGFIHGVMNTDNCSIAGETIDYGPCAFVDTYHPATVFSSIDQRGRYAYGNQPIIASWNVARLAETLLPLIDTDQDKAVELAQQVIGTFTTQFEAAFYGGLAKKLGLATYDMEDDQELCADFLALMAKNKVDFTLAFRRLADVLENGDATLVRSLFEKPEDFDKWAERWHQRRAQDNAALVDTVSAMRRVNPAYIPRNHQVEAVIQAAVQNDDFSPFETLLDVLAHPFDEHPEYAEYGLPPLAHQRVMETFCGT